MTRLLLLLTLCACDGTSPDAPEPTPQPTLDPPPAEPAPEPAPAPAAAAVSSGLCPPSLGDLTGWRPPSPYVATEPVCARFQARKSGECMDAVMQAIAALPSAPAARDAPLVPSPLHLDAQCQCVPERQAAVSGCTGAADCETFARCAVTLTRDGWAPR